MVSLEALDFNGLRGIEVDGIGIVIDQHQSSDGLSWLLDELGNLLQILYIGSVIPNAKGPIESSFNDVVVIKKLDHHVGIGLCAGRIDADVEDLGGGCKELLKVWPELDPHQSSFELKVMRGCT